jgi:hypothetical protein
MTTLVWKRKGEEKGQSVNEKNGGECFFFSGVFDL